MKPRLRPHHAQRFRTVQAVADQRATTLPVPGFRQARSYTCGFATALMVVRYFGMDISAFELFRRLQTGRDGTRQSALVRELRAAGLRANVRYDVDFARVCQAIDRNKLVVAYLEDLEHWLLVYGYDLGGHGQGRELVPARLFVADPRPGIPCEQPWATLGPRLGGFGIICSHPQDSAAYRQTPLALAEPATPILPTERAGLLASVPPTPIVQLRCEVRQAEPAPDLATSAQLSFPFCA